MWKWAGTQLAYCSFQLSAERIWRAAEERGEGKKKENSQASGISVDVEYGSRWAGADSRAKSGVTAVPAELQPGRGAGAQHRPSSSSRLFSPLPRLSIAMEPNSPKKIQFAVPLFQSQIDPEAAEQVRRMSFLHCFQGMGQDGGEHQGYLWPKAFPSLRSWNCRLNTLEVIVMFDILKEGEGYVL